MTAVIASSLLLAAPAAFGHGGEDHDAPAPAPARAAAPRASAASEDFELVAVLQDGKLLFYLDRHASNEPVAGARLEIDGGVKGIAAETAPGVYAIDASAIATGKAAGARYPLTIAVETADSADLLTATLEVAPEAAAAPHVHGWGEWAAWLGAAAVAAIAAVLVALRRRKRHKGSH